MTLNWCRYLILMASTLWVFGCHKATDDTAIQTDEKERKPVTLEAAPTVEPVIFSFKGVPFDQPGVEESLVALCTQNPMNLKAGKCSFKSAEMEMHTHYGADKDQLVSVKLAEDGSLSEVDLVNYTFMLERTVAALVRKYGEPSRPAPAKEYFLSDQSSPTFAWIDSFGTRITYTPLAGC